MDDQRGAASSREEETNTTPRISVATVIPMLLVVLVVYVGLSLAIRLMGHVLLAAVVGGSAVALSVCAMLYAHREQRGRRRAVAFWLAIALFTFGFLAGFPPAWSAALAWLESSRSPVPGSLVFGFFFVLIGGSIIWVGFAIPRASNETAATHASARRPTRPMTRIEAWLWRTAWIVAGIGFICLGVIVPRYSQGTRVAIPVHGPPLDQVISIVFLVGVLAFLPLMLAWALVNRYANQKWKAARRAARDSRAETSLEPPESPPT